MPGNTTASVTRRHALRRGAAAGAVIWGAPMVLSSKAHAIARGGSTGSKVDGPLDSVTCVWSKRNYVRNQNTPSPPLVDLSGVQFAEIDGGRGWKVVPFGASFVVYRGFALKFRHMLGTYGSTGMPAAVDDGTSEPVETSVPTTVAEVAEPTPETTEAPTTTEVVVPTTEVVVPTTEAVVPTTAPPAPAAPTVTTTPTTVAPATTEATAPEVPTTTTPTVEAPQSHNDAVDSINIDMSGRTDINVGDVFGYFQIVDADPA